MVSIKDSDLYKGGSSLFFLFRMSLYKHTTSVVIFHCKSVKLYEHPHFGVYAEVDRDMEEPSVWLLLQMPTHLYSIYNRSKYKINKTSRGDLSCCSIKVCHRKPACPSVITDVKTAGKPKNWSYNLAVTAFSKEAVFFHHSAPQLGFIISFSFILHPKVIMWVLCRVFFFPH